MDERGPAEPEKPVAAILCLADYLSGGRDLDRSAILVAAHQTSGYILEVLEQSSRADSTVKTKKMSRKQLSHSLSALAGESVIDERTFPFWLAPVLFGLSRKWLAAPSKCNPSRGR